MQSCCEPHWCWTWGISRSGPFWAIDCDPLSFISHAKLRCLKRELFWHKEELNQDRSKESDPKPELARCRQHSFCTEGNLLETIYN